MGTVHRGLQDYAIGRRGPEGWSSESALPAGSSDRVYAVCMRRAPWCRVEDLTKMVFGAFGSYVPDNPVTAGTSAALYEGALTETVELATRPRIPDPTPAPRSIGAVSFFQPLGASPDLSTMYFWSGPTLLPSDAARAPFYNPNDPDGAASMGVVRVLRRGAHVGRDVARHRKPGRRGAGGLGWLVSRCGPTSPRAEVTGEPGLAETARPCCSSARTRAQIHFGRLTQLYVRRGGHSTLVSHTAGGAPAPSGVRQFRR